MGTVKSGRLALVAAAVAVGFAGVPGAASPATWVVPGANGRIVYTSTITEFGVARIFVVSGDGTVSPILSGREPAWSPDGRFIAFSVPAPAGLAAQIAVARADGSGARELTSGFFDHGPTWSPDGSRIAFVRGANQAAEIWVMNADGSGQAQVTRVAPALSSILDPEWSPDGQSLVFRGGEQGTPGDSRIFVVAADGSGVRSLTPPDAVGDHGPSWSPDGTRIAFYTDAGTAFGPGVPSWGLDVMNADGSGRTRLATISNLRCPCRIPEFNPSWSPDGRQIVFAADEDENRDIFVVNADGSGRQRLTSGSSVDFAPAWQPAVDLSLTQRLRPARVRVGGTVRTTIVVRNVSQRGATDVTVTASVARGVPVAVSSTRGTCSRTRVFRCALGAVAGGEAVTVTVSVRAARAGALVFRASAASAEAEATAGNNSASARAAVLRRR
jgi:uncharacterized repeat protein (TIGR01451 family)